MTKDDKDELDPRTQAGRAMHIIEGIKDRHHLSIIIGAAEKRDAHLASLESLERQKRLWSKFSHIKKGDFVFAHAKPTGRNEWLWGKQLTVTKVQPRAKIVEVRGDKRGVGVKLTAFMLDAYKVSLTPTAEAFNNALAGDDTLGRKAGK